MPSPRPIQNDDLDQVARFLRRVFENESSSFADVGMLDWKYLHPRPGWTGSRGFLIETNDQIVAYGGIVPATFRLSGGGTVSSVAVIDWAADRKAPGAGVVLIKSLLEKAGNIFSIGGSPTTRQILPKIGFHDSGNELLVYARWLRPWREFWLRPKDFRAALRLAHGMADSFRRKPLPAEGWQCVAVSEFAPSLQALLDRTKLSLTFCQRTVGELNYMLRCPSVRMNGYLLQRGGETAGYFILAKTGWEARIVDILVDSAHPEDWRSAYAVASLAAMREPEVCRIRAWATAPVFSRALLHNGFWLQQKLPILVWDPKNALANAFPVNLQMFDGDFAYLT